MGNAPLMAPLQTSYPELCAPLQSIQIRGASRPRPGDPTLYEAARPAWQAQAACLGYISQGKDWWFPGKGQAGNTTKQAKEVCDTCPVSAECLADAIAQGPYCVGIWAGTTQDERKELRVRGTKPGPKRSEKHTAYRYSKHGCRCDECRDAHMKAMARYRARKKVA